MRPVKRHRWMKPGRRATGWGRKCIDCGLQRRIKKGTHTAWEWRVKPGEVWIADAPYCIAPKPKTVGVG